MSDHNKILPCLKSIGPWWTEADRRLLFCYLLKIFPFEASYLVTLPAASYIENGTSYDISEKDIEKEYLSFCSVNGNKKCSCAGIRKLNFSFGKLNSRICFLCPYSSTFKNKNQADERRMLYYMLQAVSHTLKDFLDESNKKSEDVFISHFPIYAKDILVDAFPFSIIAKEFEVMPENKYLKDPSMFSKEMLAKLYLASDKRVKYQRKKEIYQKFDRHYDDSVHACIESEFHMIEIAKPEINSINRIIVNRLFRKLSSGRTPYVPLKPEQYEYDSKKLMIPNLFNDHPIMEGLSGDESAQSKPKTSVTLKPDSSKNFLENPLENYEDDFFRGLPSLDKINDAVNTAAPDQVIFPSVKKNIIRAVKDAPSPNSDVHIKKENTDQSKMVSLPSFPDFYSIEDTGWFFKYENDDDTNKALLYALTSESSYFCMEPAMLNANIKGLLLMNSDKDFIFYPIEYYGPKIIKEIVNSKIPIYTCSTYALCRYLHRNKIFHINVSDLSVAMSIRDPLHVPSAAQTLDAKMKSYPEEYINILNSLNTDQKKALRRYEQFIPLLASNGGEVPFSDICSLYKQKSSIEYEPLFRIKNMPKRTGIFLSINAVIENHVLSKDNWQELYMDTCIELERFVPFEEGRIFLLKLNEYGMLLYITGNEMDMQEAQLYLKACIRRIFWRETNSSFPVRFESHYKIYDLKTACKG